MSRADVTADMNIAADRVKNALGTELLPMEDGNNCNRRQDERQQRPFRTSRTQVSARKYRKRHRAN